MTRVAWSDTSKRLFETGLDRGVLYPRSAPAVAWNGLTSVDESGSDDAVVYYLEGRPFLIVPKPKEYEANIKAYTFPDEFSEKMGLAEATDGMYVDSQQGDVFDLSYRTLIGNAVQGIDFGYKIHLIYNASVSTDGASYASITNQINPSEFSWKISTVPVKLTGFRSTAHVIIDTRHLDANMVAEIEDLIYGSVAGDETPFRLPLPQVIFDAMNFGDEVVVVDNGDDTWTASGSYRNIALDDNGDFTIDNVDATFVDSDTYYFGPTAPDPDDPPPDPGGGDPTPPTEYDGGVPSGPGSDEVDGGSPAVGGSTDVDGGSA